MSNPDIDELREQRFAGVDPQFAEEPMRNEVDYLHDVEALQDMLDECDSMVHRIAQVHMTRRLVKLGNLMNAVMKETENLMRRGLS